MRRICRKWTQEEDQCIRAFTGKLPIFAIARKIGRTIQAVKNRRMAIGAVEFHRHKYTQTDMEILARHDLSISKKAEIIGVTYRAVASLLLRQKNANENY